jgi:hypothetical protein
MSAIAGSSAWQGMPAADRGSAASILLGDLHANIWSSLRHTLDVDRVTVLALWLANFGGMVMTIIAAQTELRIPLVATVFALGVVDYFLYRVFRNSQSEARRLIALLTEIYADHGLGQYFDELREDYFVERYNLRLRLCPVLLALALVLGFAFGFGT